MLVGTDEEPLELEDDEEIMLLDFEDVVLGAVLELDVFDETELTEELDIGEDVPDVLTLEEVPEVLVEEVTEVDNLALLEGVTLEPEETVLEVCVEVVGFVEEVETKLLEEEPELEAVVVFVEVETSEVLEEETEADVTLVALVEEEIPDVLEVEPLLEVVVVCFVDEDVAEDLDEDVELALGEDVAEVLTEELCEDELAGFEEL